ncbi:hypothetical protein DES42_103228 [Zavarzinia compransoris]|uniref:Oxidoreductase molybdopterin-binding domain-containing protein n=2 Tax=Zavarzinia compransoris TaxID=1264899 RepID=A0A317E541_9PROT|nr:hypothetical protein DKG75_09480 [Zavarzinia compransoris]TDP47060.1 hypothetical protein DES42_103228 [Zavarzinia compransoris]
MLGLGLAAGGAAGLVPLSLFAPARAAGGTLLSLTDRAGRTSDFDLAALRALPQGTIAQITPWTETVNTYGGPRLRAVLAAGGVAAGETLTMTALNDYAVEVPMADVRAYDLLLAMTCDGEAMPVRDKGPLWLHYPLAEYPALARNEIHARMIWQLRRIAVS